VISRAGRKSRTQVFEISLLDGVLSRLNLDATTPKLIVSRTANEA
jgi:hypothetical protein